MRTLNKPITAAVLALLCVLSFSACTKKTPPEASAETSSEESPETLPEESLSLDASQFPEGVKLIGTVTIEKEAVETTTTEGGNKPDVAYLLLSEAQEKGGNAIINITQSVIEKDGKGIWLSSATAVKINDGDFDNIYKELFSITPKSNDRVYGVGSAKMRIITSSLTTARTRAQAVLARAYSETTVNEGVTVTTSNVTIKDSSVEQFAISPDETVWITMSARKDAQ